MAADRKIQNLKDFSPYRDENGQGMTDDPSDVARQDDVHAQLGQEPTGDAETARLASGFTGDDATAATEAETPAENIAHISDATLPKPGEDPDKPMERATAALGTG